MKLAKYYLLAIILLSLAYNWQGISFALYGAIGGLQYTAGDLPHALESYDRAARFATGSENTAKFTYDRATVLYGQASYTDTASLYEKIQTSDTELRRRTAYNLGNTHYRIGESLSGTGRIAAWQRSLGSYEESLKIGENTNTRENYEYVKKKLSEEQKAQEEKKEKEKQKQSENTSGSGSKSGSGSSGGGGEKTSTGGTGKSPEKQPKSEQTSSSGTTASNPSSGTGWQTWTNQWGYNGIAGNTESDNKRPLTSDEIRELENYGSSLREFQKQNGKYLNPDPEGNNPNGFIDQFFTNPMFQNMLPQSGKERDW